MTLHSQTNQNIRVSSIKCWIAKYGLLNLFFRCTLKLKTFTNIPELSLHIQKHSNVIGYYFKDTGYQDLLPETCCIDSYLKADPDCSKALTCIQFYRLYLHPHRVTDIHWVYYDYWTQGYMIEIILPCQWGLWQWIKSLF